MNPWLVFALAVLFGTGLLTAHFAAGRARFLGLVVMLSAAAGSLVAVRGPATAAWVVGPLAGCALLSADSARPPLTFEPLILRLGTAGALIGAAGVLASKLPVGQVAWPLIALPCIVGTLGLTWAMLPQDPHEAARGAVLGLAGGAALLLLVGATDAVTAGVAGALASLPALRRHWKGLDRFGLVSKAPWLYGALALLAGALAAGGASSGLGLGALAPSSEGSTALALALAFASAALLEPSRGSGVVLLSAVSLVSAIPAIRWAGLAGAAALLIEGDVMLQRLVWAGAGLLALAAAFAGLLPQSQAVRVAPVALAAGWLLLISAVRNHRARALLIPVATFYLIASVFRLPAGALPRFQLLAAAGALLLVLSAFAAPLETPRPDPGWTRATLTTALLLVAISTARPEGVLAAVLLVVDLAIVQPASTLRRGSSLAGFLVLPVLAASGWPGAAAFAARTLALVAAVQVGPALAALAAVLMIALLLRAPFEGQPERTPAAPVPAGARWDRPRKEWIVTLVSLTCGLLPALVRRLIA